MKRSIVVNIHELLNPTADADLTVYEPQPGDRETQASITVADWKEALLAINVLSRRQYSLVRDVERLEKSVVSLERGLQAVSDYHE